MYKKCEEILNKLESEGKIKISDYQFPPKQELKLRLKDMLEDEVGEKYYLSDKMMKYIAPTQSTQCGSTTSSATVLYSEYSKKKIEQNINAINSELSGTLTANCMQSINHDNCQMTFTNNLRIRKLTPKECWRLMGFDDEDFEKASQVNSNSQLYKQAGNSICVPVLENILSNLLK